MRLPAKTPDNVFYGKFIDIVRLSSVNTRSA